MYAQNFVLVANVKNIICAIPVYDRIKLILQKNSKNTKNFYKTSSSIVYLYTGWVCLSNLMLTRNINIIWSYYE